MLLFNFIEFICYKYNNIIEKQAFSIYYCQNAFTSIIELQYSKLKPYFYEDEK